MNRCETGALASITEIDRICLVLSAMSNRIFGPYLAVINRILISVDARRSVSLVEGVRMMDEDEV
jgi:hypothetical protein